MRFVIADDSTVMRNYLKNKLVELGHIVIAECRSARESVAACAEHKPDVAVLDIAMPDNNGGAHVLEILAAGTASQVVIASSIVESEYDWRLDEMRKRGAITIRKPLTGKSIEQMLTML